MSTGPEQIIFNGPDYMLKRGSKRMSRALALQIRSIGNRVLGERIQGAGYGGYLSERIPLGDTLMTVGARFKHKGDESSVMAYQIALDKSVEHPFNPARIITDRLQLSYDFDSSRVECWRSSFETTAVNNMTLPIGDTGATMTFRVWRYNPTEQRVIVPRPEVWEQRILSAGYAAIMRMLPDPELIPFPKATEQG